MVDRSFGMREVGGSIPGRVKQKTLTFEVLLCLALSMQERPTGRLRVRIIVWVGTSLPTRGVVFQWASTIKSDRLAKDGSSTYTHHIQTRPCS